MIFTGCTTSVCVESTLRDAYFRDYQAVLLTDCVAEPIGQASTRTNHDASVLLVETVFGWAATSEQFIVACSAHHAAASTGLRASDGA